MSDRPKWMPVREVLQSFLRAETVAPERFVLDEQIDLLEDRFELAVAMALAEDRAHWGGTLSEALGMGNCHPDFEAVWDAAFATPVFWAEYLKAQQAALVRASTAVTPDGAGYVPHASAARPSPPQGGTGTRVVERCPRCGANANSEAAR